jgi:hypothetical protein
MSERSVPITNKIFSLITFLSVKVNYELKLFASSPGIFEQVYPNFTKFLMAVV